MDDTTADPQDLSDTELEAAIGSLAARVAALQCRFLLLAAEVDRRRLWARWGMQSAVAWLSWRCGLDPVTAREHLRVGHALGQLPVVREAFGAGRLSYSKVRALSRVATPDDEAGWVDTAVDLPASQLASLTRAYRKAVSDPGELARGYVRWSWDDDGSLVLSARLPAEQGALVVAAIEQSRDALAKACRTLPPVDSADASAVATSEAGPTAVDALTLVASAALAAGPRAGASPTPYQVVLHIASDRQHLAHGPGVSDAAVRRVACDAVVTALVHDLDGNVTSVGRRLRCVPPRLRRALDERDGGRCKHPGCVNRRFLEAHHVVPWLDGGPTELENLVLLCSFHHDTLHCGAFTIEGNGDQTFVFRDSTGLAMAPAPRLEDVTASPLRPRLFRDREPSPGLLAGTWDGDRLDLDWAVAVLAGNHEVRRRAAAA